MKRLAKLPVWYSVVSDVIALLLVVLMLINSGEKIHGGAAQDLLFFFLLAGYFNCLPLAIVSIFLFFRKDMWKYSLLNFAAIIVVLYFEVQVFGTAI